MKRIGAILSFSIFVIFSLMVCFMGCSNAQKISEEKSMKKPNKKKAWIIVAIVVGGLIAFGLIWQDMHAFKYASKADAQLMDRVVGPVEEWTSSTTDIEEVERQRCLKFNWNTPDLHIDYRYVILETTTGGNLAELVGDGEMYDETQLQWNLILFSEAQREHWEDVWKDRFEKYDLEPYVDLTVQDIKEYAAALYAGAGEEDYPAFDHETLPHDEEIEFYTAWEQYDMYYSMDDGYYFGQYIRAHRPDIQEADDIGTLTADELVELWREYSAQEDYSTHVDK
jgi:hypothetical protein